MDRDWSDFVDLCDDEILRAEDIPEAGHDFAMSVTDKLKGMKKWAEENEHATEKMWGAAERMRGGIGKWLNGRD